MDAHRQGHLINRNRDDEEDERRFRIGGRVAAGLTFGLLLLAGAGGWAATAELTGAVIATGAVKVDRNLKAIQHRDGGIVSEIAVREGDFVEAGQVLLRLDDVQTRAELSIVRAQLAELAVKKARLMAERDGLSRMELPELSDDAGRHIDDVVRGETRLLEGNLRNRKTETEQLTLSMEQLGEEIAGLEAQHASKLDEIELVEREHGKIKGLADQKLIEGSRVFTTKRELARLNGEKAEIEAGIARAKVRISEVKLQVLAVDETARTEAQRELSAVEPKLAELRERAAAIEDRLQRTDIRAPIAGIVNELSVNTLGGVITPAEKLVTIVPEGAELKIEAKLAPTDIDQVQVGQAAKLRFSAFNQRTTPEIFGEIAYVSAATSVDPASGQPLYLAEVKISADEMAKLGDNKLRPGMPLEVFISTEDRTAISYLAKPLLDQFERALREQ
ncbi:HlyD family type I secretion periplasmic adaptor subunit [Mesorhizobium sp. YM1C-6-2]|uniref:HlyD family type I secretion periplasmic adaptor subunit n=1 Tax=Mesorhizobium sp. YM1C-6-2 TaxID=1827501 RepID=UPI000EF22F34|nr:HlyD family type I secretion periplasmic adaptor subunit [Mesorhizobium sp. YM1C-6-2]RLP23628.1 HlyD family type I secretion periplasmic adaptor subunit [Mesorhizobium sp. YM1C-6-2]